MLFIYFRQMGSMRDKRFSEWVDELIALGILNLENGVGEPPNEHIVSHKVKSRLLVTEVYLSLSMSI